MNKPNKARELAKKAINCFDELTCFEADQTVTAGQVYVKAHLKFKKPAKIAMEYEAFQNPMEDINVTLGGGPQFVGDELRDFRFVFDGRSTWIHDPKRELAYKQRGKQFYSPLGETDVIGQLGFLSPLTSDFLIKDEGRGTVNGNDVLRLGIKPKVNRRSLFLKEEYFPLKKAVLALDVDSGFPYKITYYPREEAGTFSPLALSKQIIVEYSNVSFEELPSTMFEFDSDSVKKLFTEKRLAQEEFTDLLPVPFDFAFWEERGFEPLQDKFTLTLNRDEERGYGSMAFAKSGDGEESSQSCYLHLWAGNYLSRQMNRHRSFLSKDGENVTVGDLEGRIGCRGEEIEHQLPHQLKKRLWEIGWEEEKQFYYMLGQNLDRDDLVELAKGFRAALSNVNQKS